MSNFTINGTNNNTQTLNPADRDGQKQRHSHHIDD